MAVAQHYSRPGVRGGSRWDDDIEMDHQKWVWVGMDWIDLA